MAFSHPTSAREFEGFLRWPAGRHYYHAAGDDLRTDPRQGGLYRCDLCRLVKCLLEKPVRRFVPDIVDVIVTPTLVLLVMAAALLFIIMPAAGIVFNGILSGLNGLLEHGGIAHAGFCAFGLFLISLGLHHVCSPIHSEMINATGHAPFCYSKSVSNAGMVGAAASGSLPTRDPVMKKTAGIPTSILAGGTDNILASISPQDLRLLPAY